LILSEVNPAGSVVGITRQAEDWLGLVEEVELDQFQMLPYSKQVVLLHERAKLKGKVLIIRDWVTANYLKWVSGFSVEPSFILEQPVYLAHAGYLMRPLVITRKASDVYRSIRRSFIQFKNLSEEDFLLSYLTYARAVSSFPRVSLEALQSNPDETLKYIFRSLGLSTDSIDKQLEAFADFHQCTGNNTLIIPSATSRLRNITPVVGDSFSTNASVNVAAFAEVDVLLGYEA
jgi:hypothetical protein